VKSLETARSTRGETSPVVPTGTGEDSTRRSHSAAQPGRRTQDSARGDHAPVLRLAPACSREHSDLCGSSSTWRQSFVCYILNGRAPSAGGSGRDRSGRRDDDEEKGRGSSTDRSPPAVIPRTTNAVGIISEPPSRGTGWPLEIEVPDEVDPDFCCEAVGVSLLFGWLGQTGQTERPTDHCEYGPHLLSAVSSRPLRRNEWEEVPGVPIGETEYGAMSTGKKNHSCDRRFGVVPVPEWRRHAIRKANEATQRNRCCSAAYQPCGKPVCVQFAAGTDIVEPPPLDSYWWSWTLSLS